MAQAHYHMSDGKVVIEECDTGIAHVSAAIRRAHDEGSMIVVKGFDEGGIDSVLVNPDHIVKVFLIAD